MIAPEVNQMTMRLTKFADASKALADMELKMPKTYSQHVRRQDEVTPATPQEIKTEEQEYKFPCYFCDAGCNARFKTELGMTRHAITCDFNYAVTSKYYEINHIRSVFGKAERKLFLVRWGGRDMEKATTAGRPSTPYYAMVARNPSTNFGCEQGPTPH